jgi:hypothetical protein
MDRQKYIDEVLLPEMRSIAESCAESDHSVGVFALDRNEAFDEILGEMQDKFEWEQDELETYAQEILSEFHFDRDEDDDDRDEF